MCDGPGLSGCPSAYGVTAADNEGLVIECRPCPRRRREAHRRAGRTGEDPRAERSPRANGRSGLRRLDRPAIDPPGGGNGRDIPRDRRARTKSANRDCLSIDRVLEGRSRIPGSRAAFDQDPSSRQCMRSADVPKIRTSITLFTKRYRSSYPRCIGRCPPLTHTLS
jgi:hypothetical protein